MFWEGTAQGAIGCRDQGVGRLQLVQKALTALPGNTADADSPIFEAGIQQYDASPVEGADLLHLVIVRGRWSNQHQHAITAAIGLLQTHLVSEAGNAGGKGWRVALGQGRGTGIGAEQLCARQHGCECPMQP